MSRSVSAPSSVTNTSPCWNGLIVPGSTLMYGSNFCIWTFSPRAFRRRPRDAAVMPFPSDETTPPVTKTNLVSLTPDLRRPSGGANPRADSRNHSVPNPHPPLAWADRTGLTGRSGFHTLGPLPLQTRTRRVDSLIGNGEGGGVPGTRAAEPAARLPALSLAQRGEELGAAEHALELLDTGVGRVSGHLLDPEVTVGEARDRRQVRDRDHLRAAREPAQRLADRVGGAAADAGVDLVEDHRVPASDRGDRERDPRELPARRGLRDGRLRKARIGADQEPDRVDARRAGLDLAEHGAELTLGDSDLRKLRRHRLGEWRRRCAPSLSEPSVHAPHPVLGGRERLRSSEGRVAPLSECSELFRGGGPAREELGVALRTVAPLGVRDPLELGLHRRELFGIRLERLEEPAQRRRGLTQRQLDVAQLGSRCRQLRSELLERPNGALSLRDQIGRADGVVGGDDADRRRDAFGELRQAPQPLSHRSELVLVALPPTLGVRHEALQLFDPGRGGGGLTGQLVVRADRREQLAPRTARLATEVEDSREGVEHRELVARAREPALLELAAHRDQPLGDRGHVLAGDGAPPRVGSRPAVCEDASREHERLLVVRP